MYSAIRLSKVTPNGSAKAVPVLGLLLVLVVGQMAGVAL